MTESTTDRAAAPVKQRADCTETEWAEQERARFERLYTRETVRADLAEQRADTAARDADIYQQRLERLGEGYTKQRQRADQAEAQAERLRTDRAAACICGHKEAQHFEDACLVCDCGDYLVPEAAREVIARWRAAATRAPADRAAVLREAADVAEAQCQRNPWTTAADVIAELRRLAAEPAAAGPGRTADETQEDPARVDRLRPEFFEHASVESIDVQIRRAQTQQRQWGNRVKTLTILRQARVMQKELGEWPAPTLPAGGSQQAKDADSNRVVAYRSALPGAWSIYCTRHTSELGDGIMPLTSDDLPDGGLCASCGVDVLIEQQPKEAGRG
ncbi:hypothetical protein OV320_2645 [Actinobacteria bacterium OV320]|nr:hypothetical protein OV320_2645 [Actinobacteria bacterium OV320]